MLVLPVLRKPAAALLGVKGLGRLLAAQEKVLIQVDLLRARVNGVLQPTDIFLDTYPRSGTTWMQMILFQLITGGDGTFRHIIDVSPHYELSLHLGGLPPLPPPRVLKSHLRYFEVPKSDCRYIYVLRDARDTAVSYYNFYRRYRGYTESLEVFLQRFLDGKVMHGSWFTHVSRWLANPKHLNILYVRYEELAADLEAEIRRIAQFCGLPIEAARMDRILRNCSFEYMQQNEQRFALENYQNYNTNVGFLRSGRVGEGAPQVTGPLAEAFRKKAAHHLPGDLASRYA